MRVGRARAALTGSAAEAFVLSSLTLLGQKTSATSEEDYRVLVDGSGTFELTRQD